MFLCVRTTIDIQDDLLVELKRIAAESNRTLKDLVEDAIRTALALRKSEVAGDAPQPLATFKGKGVQRGVNLDNTSELLDLIDGTR